MFAIVHARLPTLTLLAETVALLARCRCRTRSPRRRRAASVSGLRACGRAGGRRQDMLCCGFARFVAREAAAGRGPHVRPTVRDGGPLAIEDGRHPILEHALGEVIPNNCFLSDASSLLLLSGANMARAVAPAPSAHACAPLTRAPRRRRRRQQSGKTTFMKQTALLAVLAHAGCFVPAAFASMPLLDRIYVLCAPRPVHARICP